MALNRWSLDRLLVWIGTTSLIILFVPIGLYITQNVSTAAEESLLARARSIGNTLATQLVEPMLVEDRLTLHDALHKAEMTERDIYYLCIEDAQGRIMAHTFDGGFPSQLTQLRKGIHGEIVRFRTENEPLLDISVPIMESQLGTLRVGMSRGKAIKATNRLSLLMGIALCLSISVVFVGANLVAKKVSRPLHQLEAEVSRFPQQYNVDQDLNVSGTKEVESLAKGFRDMAQRLILLEREREATQERMVNAERLAVLGELAAGLAHEIHNPLDGMLECLRFLDSEQTKSERAAKYYPMLNDGLQRIAGVMRKMLTFARSGQNISIEVCSVAEVLEALELLLQADLKKRNVRFSWKCPKNCLCLCDRNGLTQAGLNLILNAAEAVEQGEDKQVRIKAINDSQWVYVFVEDSGPGISSELSKRIFAPFFTSKPSGKGTGLGLSVSRELIRASGGEIELARHASLLGGAKFIIRLPMAPLEARNG